MRDTQKERVYRWGDLLEPRAAPDRLSLEECEKLIAKIWKHYKVAGCWGCSHSRPPKVKDGRRTRIARGGLYAINLPRWSRTRVVVLHEIAHAITEHTHYHECGKFRHQCYAGHGPEFCRVFLKLLVRYGKFTTKEVRGAAKTCRVSSVRPYPRLAEWGRKN